MAINKQMKILIVDDFPIMRRIVKNLLIEIGYTNISEAEDGHNALFKLQKAGDFDFLITDWNMPTMSGLELLKAVRADPKLCKLPVLMVTAQVKRESILMAVQAGVNGYVVKPFNAATLKEKIEKVLTSKFFVRKENEAIESDSEVVNDKK